MAGTDRGGRVVGGGGKGSKYVNMDITLYMDQVTDDLAASRLITRPYGIA